MKKRLYTCRARFGVNNDIVAEFLPPVSYAKRKAGKTYTDNVIIFAPGMPSSPSQGLLMETWARRGYWVIFPRYRGTWESSGKFLEKSPHEDIREVIDGLTKPLVSLWDGKKFFCHPKHMSIFASSFGGPAGLLNSKDPRVSAVIAFSPMVDWRVKSKREPLEHMGKFLQSAYGEAFRFVPDAWQKLQRGNFYNPATEVQNIEGSKVLIIHAQDDDVIAIAPVRAFAKATGSTYIALKKGGHFGLAASVMPTLTKRIQIFLKKHENSR